MPAFVDVAMTRFTRFCIQKLPTPSLNERLWRRHSWRNSKFTVSSNNGFLLSGETADLVQGSVFYFGEWEPNLTSFVKERLKGQARTFIDVGANVGYFSLLALQAMPRGRVVAIEAFPSIFEKLIANVGLNQFDDRIRCINVAATSQEMSVEMVHGPARNTGRTSIVHGDNTSSDKVSVQGVPLSSVLGENEIATTRLLKMDIEGAEADALEGMASLLPNFPDDAEFIVEIIPAAIEAGKLSFIFELFGKHGFNAYVLDELTSAQRFRGGNDSGRPRRIEGLRENDVDATNVVFSRNDSDAL